MTDVTHLGLPQTKIVDYLLNPDHPEGWSKAKFFLARGFKREDPMELVGALVRHAIRGWPGDEILTIGATKHRLVGPIVCPDGTTPTVLTVWHVPHGGDTAMLVTARPHRREKSSSR